MNQNRNKRILNLIEEIIKIRAGINEIETRKTKEKMNKTESWILMTKLAKLSLRIKGRDSNKENKKSKERLYN